MRMHLLHRLAFVFTVALGVASAAAQDSAVNGKALFDDTPGASGISTLTASCINCHGSVQNRRIAIGGSAFADIAFDTAMTRFVQAVQNQPQMAQFGALSTQQARDIAAYIADTPKTSASQLSFAPGAINTVSTAQSVDLTAAVATTESLQVTDVAISGAGAARFNRSSDTCLSQTLAPGASCRVSVTFSAPDTNNHMAVLTLTVRQGASATSFTRTVNLSGAVPPASPPPSTDAGGGGAFDWYWLAALGVAIFLLQRYRSRR